ncbi:MAG: hypothetical protein ABGY96_06315 [bacterium]|nr:hypothetical protein [Pseudomonadales bacterium]
MVNESQINGFLALTLLMVLFLSGPASSQTKDQDTVSREPRGFSQRESSTGYTDSLPVFGGPTSSEGQLEEADRVLDPAFRFPAIDEFYQPWTDWKTTTNKQQGVQISTHYSTMAQYLSDPIPDGEDKASAGVFRGTLVWSPFQNKTDEKNSVNIMIDHRHGFRDTVPANLAAEAGYIGVTSLFYGDFGWAIINLNWQQSFNNQDTGLIVGRYDPNDYMNVLGHVNPWSLFSNLDSNLDTSVALPDSSWGIGVGHWLNDQWYAFAGANDANGFGNDDLEFFDGGSEFFKYGNIGWSPGKADRYFKKYTHAGVACG